MANDELNRKPTGAINGGYNLPAVIAVFWKRANAEMSVRKSKKRSSDQSSGMLFDLELPVSQKVPQESIEEKEGTRESMVESARATSKGSNREWTVGELAERAILAGTSAFTAAGWEGTFYPAGMKARSICDFMRRGSEQWRWTARFMERRSRNECAPGMRGHRRILCLR